MGIIVAVLVPPVAFVTRTILEADRYQGEVGQELRRTLGFSHGSPCLMIAGKAEEVFTLHPKPGSIMAKAGVQDGDIAVGCSITEFYRALHEHRGSALKFSVVDGGDGGSLKNREERCVDLAIP